MNLMIIENKNLDDGSSDDDGDDDLDTCPVKKIVCPFDVGSTTLLESR